LSCQLGAPAKWSRLATNPEASDEAAVALDVVLPYVIKKPPAMPDELHETAARVVVADVGPEVLGQVVDAFREDRHLDFG